MADEHADMRRHMRLYVGVFLALAVFTVLTIAASLLHVSSDMHVTIALLIAAVKGTLVAAIFMHLKWEKTYVLWSVLIFTAIFFVGLILLPSLTMGNVPYGTEHSTWG